MMHLHGDLFSWHSAVSWLAAGLMVLAYACGRLATWRAKNTRATAELPDLTQVVDQVPGKVKIHGEVYVVEYVTVQRSPEPSIQIEMSRFVDWRAWNRIVP